MMPLGRLLFLLELLSRAAPGAVGTFGIQPPSCKSKCGNIDIPYPFGIGQGCYASDYGNFSVTCDETSTSPKPMIMSNPPLEILDIDLTGRLTVKGYVGYQCFMPNGASITEPLSYDLRSLPYIFSTIDNIFTVVGCDSQAFYNSREGPIGCMTYCPTPTAVSRGGCLGYGCCYSPIPNGLKATNISISSVFNYTNVRGFNGCSFAFFAANNSYHFQSSDIYNSKLMDMHVSISLTWSIGNESCARAEKHSNDGHACPSKNSTCTDINDDVGYVCSCSYFFEGNPYRKNGCEVRKNRVRTSFVIPDQMWLWLVFGASFVLFLLIVWATCYCLVSQRRKIVIQRKNVAELKRRMFEQNGGLALQEHISCQSGNTFKLFREDELAKATDGFKENNIIGRGGHGVVYMGQLEGGIRVAIKKSRVLNEREGREFAREMAILSQINHVSIIKILGCCLEVEIPMLVYEFVSGGTLFSLIHRQRNEETFSLGTRVQIATEVSEALAYLHSYASPPIFHKDVKTSNILLDESRRAKISDFGASAVAPADLAELATVVQGTCGYLDPEYLQTHQFTDKSDVYSFGVVLMELLTGRKPFQAQDADDYRGLAMTFVSLFRKKRLTRILDAEVQRESQMGKMDEIAELACRCVSANRDDRPTMKEVAISLHTIRGLPAEIPWHSPYPVACADPCVAEASVDLETVARGYDEVSYGGSSLCTSIDGR